MTALGSAFGQGLVVEFHSLFRVQGKGELVVPAEVETGARKGVVTELSAEMSLGKVCRMGRQLIGHHTGANVVAIREPQVFLGGHVA